MNGPQNPQGQPPAEMLTTDAPITLDELRARRLAPPGLGGPAGSEAAEPPPIGTGLPFPDGGTLRPGTIVLVAGAAGMGATTVALRMAFDAARGGWTVAGREAATVPAMVDCFAGIRGQVLAELAIRALGGASATTLPGLPVHFHPPVDGLTAVERFADALSASTLSRPPRILLIDAIERLEYGGVTRQAARRVARRIHHIALSTQSVVLVTTSLASPDLERRAPQPCLDDLEEWRPLHDQAISTLLLYRDGYFYPQPKRPNLLEVYEVSRCGQVRHHTLPWAETGLDPLN